MVILGEMALNIMVELREPFGERGQPSLTALAIDSIAEAEGNFKAPQGFLGVVGYALV